MSTIRWTLSVKELNLTVRTRHHRIRRSALQTVEFDGRHSQSMNRTVCSLNRRISQSALQMSESDGLQSKSSNLTVCTMAKSKVLCEFCSPRTVQQRTSGEQATGEYMHTKITTYKTTCSIHTYVHTQQVSCVLLSHTILYTRLR